jgi:hypothetical protein
MAERMDFTTPVGRFVSGSLTEKRKTDNQNRPIEPEKQRYEFGLAIEKTEPSLPALFQQIAAHAKAGYQAQPHIAQRIDTWFQTLSGFSMKISDGDAPNQRGQVNENTKGCFVLWFSTSIEIKTCGPDNIQIDPSAIKRGWYIDVYGSCAINGLQDNNAGMYMNPEWVRLIGEGDEIVGGIDAATAFGAPAAPAALPPGARPVGSVPPAPVGAPGGGMPGAVQQAMPGAPAAVPMPAPVPAATVPAAMPGAVPTQPPAQPQTASPGETHPPHPGILGAGLPGQ